MHDVCRHGRHVDRCQDRLARKRRADSLRHVEGDADLRLDRRCAKMRREDDARHTDEWVAFFQRLAREDVDRRARDMPRLHGVSEILLVDDAAARAVDEAHALLHACDCLLVEHVLRIGIERHVHRDEIRLLDHFIERADGDAHRLGTLLVDVRIVADDVHIEGERALGDARADAPHADDAERLAAQLDTDVLLAIPLALLHRLVGDGDVAAHRKHHRHRMLRRRDRIAARRIDDDDAARRRRRHVDVVDADASAADDLELRRLVDDVLRHFRCRAHDNGLEIADDVQKLLMRKLRLLDNLKLRGKDVNRLLRYAVCYENFHIHRSSTTRCSLHG